MNEAVAKLLISYFIAVFVVAIFGKGFDATGIILVMIMVFGMLNS